MSVRSREEQSEATTSALRKQHLHCCLAPPPPPLTSPHTLLCPQAAELVAENCDAYEAHMRGVRDYLEERLAVSARVAPGAWTPRGCRGRTETYQGQDTGCSCEDPSVLRIFLFRFTLPFTLSLSEYYKEILTDKIIILWGSPGAPW